MARQAMAVAMAFSITMAVIGIFLDEHILRLVGVNEEVVAQGAPYLRIQFVGMIAMSFRMMTDSTMNASGDSMTPMRIAVIFRFFHVALCPFLVFGWWIFPRLGVNGSALTSVFSQSLGTAFGLWYLLTGRTRLRLSVKGFRLDPSAIWRLVRLGIPASIMGMQANLGQFGLVRFMALFGTFAVAGHTLNQRIEMILFMPAMGLGMAAGVLAGQNLGARQPERAERTGWLAVGLVEATMLIGVVIILLWAESIVRVFDSEPGLVKIASTYLRIATVAYSVTGLTISLQQCINGAGDTLVPMVVGLVSMWGVQIPLAFFLPRVTNLGVYGVRWGMVAGVVVGAIVYTVYFRLGRWKRKRV